MYDHESDSTAPSLLSSLCLVFAIYSLFRVDLFIVVAVVHIAGPTWPQQSLPDPPSECELAASDSSPTRFGQLNSNTTVSVQYCSMDPSLVVLPCDVHPDSPM